MPNRLLLRRHFLACLAAAGLGVISPVLLWSGAADAAAAGGAASSVESNGYHFEDTATHVHIIGAALQPRRYAYPTEYEWLRPVQGLNEFISISAFVLGTVQIIFLVNFFYSLFWGKKVDRNPWHANTLEWAAPSPPPHGNFETTPIVYRGPYEYASPESEDDYLPQSQPWPGKVPTGPPVHV